MKTWPISNTPGDLDSDSIEGSIGHHKVSLEPLPEPPIFALNDMLINGMERSKAAWATSETHIFYCIYRNEQYTGYSGFAGAPLIHQ